VLTSWKHHSIVALIQSISRCLVRNHGTHVITIYKHVYTKYNESSNMAAKYYLILNIFIHFYHKSVQYNVIITDFNWGGGVNEFFSHNVEKNYGTLLRLRTTENAHTLFVHIIKHLLNQNFRSTVDRTWGGGPVSSPT